jgi:PilZ domain-containing protein
MLMQVSREKASIKNKIRDYGSSLYYLLANRRRFERRPTTGKLVIRYKNVYGELKSQACSCADFSPRGMGIDCEEPIFPETEVALSYANEDTTRFARVRSCRRLESAFRVGLEFIPEPADWKAPAC